MEGTRRGSAGILQALLPCSDGPHGVRRYDQVFGKPVSGLVLHHRSDGTSSRAARTTFRTDVAGHPGPRPGGIRASALRDFADACVLAPRIARSPNPRYSLARA